MLYRLKISVFGVGWERNFIVFVSLSLSHSLTQSLSVLTVTAVDCLRPEHSQHCRVNSGEESRTVEEKNGLSPHSSNNRNRKRLNVCGWSGSWRVTCVLCFCWLSNPIARSVRQGRFDSYRVEHSLYTSCCSSLNARHSIECAH